MGIAPETTLTAAQARRFLLRLHGLAGPGRFSGADGAEAFIRQCGCLQFDPVDICGRSPDISLFSRVEGYTPALLASRLYETRSLVEYFDKNLAIIPREDWPLFTRTRASFAAHGRRMEAVGPYLDEFRALVEARAPLSSREVEDSRRLRWLWGNEASLPRAALEQLYCMGEIGVHHREGSVRWFAPSRRLLADVYALPDPCPDDRNWYRAMVVRRVGAVGLMWNRAGDAWLGIPGMNAARRAEALADALAAGELLPVRVEGLAPLLYCRSRDKALLLRTAESEAGPLPAAPSDKARLLAPLDALLWDRRLIEALFGFSYRWEIYVPAGKRTYGPYTLPVLWGEAFIGRADIARDRAAGLLRAAFWPEGPAPLTREAKAALRACLKEFAAFNGVKKVALSRPPAPAT